jgi:hypothetical protein
MINLLLYLPWVRNSALRREKWYLRRHLVTEPDKTRAVFVLARQDCPPVRLPEYVAEYRSILISLIRLTVGLH